MTRLIRSIPFVLTVLLLLCSTAHATVVINWVTVGNPGNANDTTGFGSVGTLSGVAYRIGKYEVTNTQYTEFLNIKAATNGDSVGLYNTDMSTNVRGGINRTGSGTVGAPYVYAVKSGRGDNPVVYVSFYDALRFANWLHNGQSSGNTEDGAYTLLGGAPLPSNGSAGTRNVGAKVFLTSENEWYKAAYHKNDGVTGNYWDYPTRTDTVPYSDNPSTLNTPDDSNTANHYRNDSLANGYNDGYSVTGSPSPVATNYLTDVGAYSLSLSAYGTFDQGGNVWEWNESVVVAGHRGLRGGSWDFSGAPVLAGSLRHSEVAVGENNLMGFRVATSLFETAAVPEPSSFVLAGLGLLGLCYIALRKKYRRA